MEQDGVGFAARLVRWRGRQDRSADDRQRRRRRGGQGGGRGGALLGRVGRDQAAHAQPAAALHHLDAAAGGGAQARLLGQPHDADRAGALRGRRDHLYADRRRADGRQRHLGRARRDRRPLRRELRARQAAHLPDQGEERAGSARGDPPDRFRPRQGRHRAIMRGSTISSGSARWRARWRRRGWSGRRSS